MASAALVILGMLLVVFGLWGYIFGNSEGSIWLIGLGVVSLIAAGIFQSASRRA